VIGHDLGGNEVESIFFLAFFDGFGVGTPCMASLLIMAAAVDVVGESLGDVTQWSRHVFLRVWIFDIYTREGGGM
jgi:hypothetical protein